MHLHLDLVGGISGNMFVAAMLDYLDIDVSELNLALSQANFEDLVTLHFEAKNDGILSGGYFEVQAAKKSEDHDHRHFSEIKKIILASSLDERVKEISLNIFTHLAEAEAQVHGTSIEKVAFHEVGAWDSIADIICAAWLINQAALESFSISKLPIGGGSVNTAHGSLPIPAPATTLLLRGFEFYDDGIMGERITPTGAAIIKYLKAIALEPGGKLLGTGIGFGSKVFPGISNITRALFFDTSETVNRGIWEHDEVIQLNFEIDDQTPEDLALSLTYIRSRIGVLDIIQGTALAKKNRVTQCIQILVKPKYEESIMKVCFDETTTIGIRRQVMSRAILRREEKTSTSGNYKIKQVKRPSSTTNKVEIDDIKGLDRISRQETKHSLEISQRHEKTPKQKGKDSK